MISDKELVARVKKHKSETDKALTTQRENIRKCNAFYEADFMDYIDQVQFQDQNGNRKRTMVQISKVQVYVDAVSGFFAQNRRKPAYVATLDNSEIQSAFSTYTTALSDYCRRNANADQAESQCDRDMLIGGIGAVETALSYGEGYATKEKNGEIIMGCLDPLAVFYDPASCTPNLLDARYCGITKQYELEEALALFSNSEDGDFEAASGSQGGEGYAYDPTLGGSYDRIRYDYYDKDSNMVNVHFYHWYEIETYYRADNPLFFADDPMLAMRVAASLDVLAAEHEFDARAEQLDVNEKAKAALEDAFSGAIEFFEFKKKVFYSAIVSGEKVFAKTLAESQQGFPIKFKTGKRYKNQKIWAGMVNSMMEPTIYYNKALTELMFVIAANSKGGAMVEEDAVDDIQEFEEGYARTDAVVIVRSGALQNGKIQPKKQAFQPTGYEQIIGFSDATISEVIGIDRTFLGSSENRMEPASLQRQRIRQSLTVLANYVDSITLYAKEHARLMLDLLRIFAENNKGALFHILGPDGAVEYAQINPEILSLEYSVDVKEAPQTADEKQENANILLQIATPLLQLGDPVGKVVLAKAIKNMAIDGEDAREIIKALMPEEGDIDPAYVKQLEQTVQQLQSDAQIANIDLLKSQTVLNKAKVDQTMADVHKKAADTVKSLEEGEQTSIENRILGATGAKEVRVNT